MLKVNCLNCKQTFVIEFDFLKDKSEIVCSNCEFKVRESDIDFEKLREGAKLIVEARNQIISGNNKIHDAINIYKAETNGDFKKWDFKLN